MDDYDRAAFVADIMKDSSALDYMKCMNPFFVRNKPFDERKESKANVLDLLGLDYMPTRCGVCPHCRAALASQWFYRLYKHWSKDCRNAYFFTLTYSPEFLPVDSSGNQTFVKAHHQLFFKRLRKAISRLSDGDLKRSRWSRKVRKEFPVRYYLISERGTKFQRVHYHVIVFNVPDCLLMSDILDPIWSYGHVDVGVLNPERIAYVTSYLIDVPDKDTFFAKHGNIMRPYSCMSKGLGKGFVGHLGKMSYVPVSVPCDGSHVSLPRAYVRWLNCSVAQRARRYSKAMDQAYTRYEKLIADRVHAGYPDPVAYVDLWLADKAASLLSRKSKSHSHF